MKAPQIINVKRGLGEIFLAATEQDFSDYPQFWDWFVQQIFDSGFFQVDFELLRNALQSESSVFIRHEISEGKQKTFELIAFLRIRTYWKIYSMCGDLMPLPTE